MTLERVLWYEVYLMLPEVNGCTIVYSLAMFTAMNRTSRNMNAIQNISGDQYDNLLTLF